MTHDQITAFIVKSLITEKKMATHISSILITEDQARKTAIDHMLWCVFDTYNEIYIFRMFPFDDSYPRHRFALIR